MALLKFQCLFYHAACMGIVAMAACAAATATAAEPAPTSPGNKKNHRNQRKYMFTNTVFIIQICQPKEQKTL